LPGHGLTATHRGPRRRFGAVRPASFPDDGVAAAMPSSRALRAALALCAPAVGSADPPVGNHVVRLRTTLRMGASATAPIIVHDTMHGADADDRGRGRHRDHRTRRRCRLRRHRPPR